MIGPVIMGSANTSKIILVGQAPGIKEGEFGKPFAWTAGKTMFRWFDSIGINEEQFRKRVYMAAVCRCFPGKNPKGGDRVPDETEIKNCSAWLKQEITLLKPELIIPVGKLAINQFTKSDKLKDVIGKQLSQTIFGVPLDIIALPHPSGASTWHRMEPGKSLLKKALKLVKQHQSFQHILK
jgi:uracil-DNA glycosylase